MLITFLGSGSAFVNYKENYQSNILIDIDGETLLYDAGTTINDALDDQTISVESVDNIYISHLHADHAGGIEYLAFKRYFSQWPFGKTKTTLISHKDILAKGWENTWRGGLEHIRGKVNELKDYFDIKELNYTDKFNICGVEFKPVLGYHIEGELSYGLEFKDDNCIVLISGDTTLPQIRARTINNEGVLDIHRYSKYQLIFHDCEFAEYPGSVHAQFHELCLLPSEIKSKMWLYHYSLNGEHIWKYDKLVEEAGFAGLVRRGQKFDTKNYSRS